MPSEREVAEFWTAKALDSQYQMLDLVQASASKWQTAIAAFLGVFATVGFVWGPDKLANFPLVGQSKAIVLALIIAGGVIGFLAGVLVNLAAQGIPTLFRNIPLTGPALMQRTAERAKSAQDLLYAAMIAAGLAGACVLGGTLWILIAAAVKPPAPLSAIVVGRSAAYCGTLVQHDGALALLLPSGKTIDVRQGNLTITAACPQ